MTCHIKEMSQNISTEKTVPEQNLFFKNFPFGYCLSCIDT